MAYPSSRVAGFWRTGQAVHIHPRGTGVHQQTGQRLGGGAGGQHVVDQGKVPAFHLGIGAQGEGVTQIVFPRLGVQRLLGVSILHPQKTVFLARQVE